MITMKDIIDDHNEKIREVSKEVALPITNEERELLLQMHEFLVNSQDPETSEKYDLRPAVGIAAIQLGIPKKMLAVVVPKDEEEDYEFALANPKIISESIQKAYLKNGEGCLSVEEEHEGIVPRAARIKVKGFDLLRNEEIVISASGYLASVLQHEMDHFNGTLFYDHINVTNPWQEIPDAKVIE